MHTRSTLIVVVRKEASHCSVWYWGLCVCVWVSASACVRVPVVCVLSLLGCPGQLAAEGALDLGDDGIVGDGLARLVLIDHLRLHVELLCQLLLRKALGGASLHHRKPQLLINSLVCKGQERRRGGRLHV